jgi:orotidine-5'-phosphate decarboxylase
MVSQIPSDPAPAPAPMTRREPRPVVALDHPTAREALALVERLPRAEWVKVGLQLFTAAGPDVVRDLRGLGRRVFLDLKLHDIPNTVAHAVESAAGLGAELLTVHASGGRAMLRAASRAAPAGGEDGLRLLAVTVLTSLDGPAVGEAWGRERVGVEDEVVRLAALAAEEGIAGVVSSVHEAASIRSRVPAPLLLLTPGIRLAGDAAGDQSRVATPADAARLGVDFLVVGRSVTAAPDPAAAFERVLAEVSAGAAPEVVA